VGEEGGNEHKLIVELCKIFPNSIAENFPPYHVEVETDFLSALGSKTNEVVSFKFSSNREFAVVVELNRGVHIFERKTQTSGFLKHRRALLADFDCKNKLIATVSNDDTPVLFWNPENENYQKARRSKVFYIDPGKTYKSSYVCGSIKDSIIQIWDPETSTCLQTLYSYKTIENHSQGNFFNSIYFNLEGKLFAKNNKGIVYAHKKIDRLDQLFLVYIFELFRMNKKLTMQKILSSELFKKAWNSFTNFEKEWLKNQSEECSRVSLCFLVGLMFGM
jgi:WD40 repeat protein